MKNLIFSITFMLVCTIAFANDISVKHYNFEKEYKKIETIIDFDTPNDLSFSYEIDKFTLKSLFLGNCTFELVLANSQGEVLAVWEVSIPINASSVEQGQQLCIMAATILTSLLNLQTR